MNVKWMKQCMSLEIERTRWRKCPRKPDGIVSRM